MSLPARAGRPARPRLRYARPMLLAELSYAMKFNIGLIGVFFVVFPLLVNGLIGFAAAQAMVEKRENDRFLEEHRTPGHDI